MMDPKQLVLPFSKMEEGINKLLVEAKTEWEYLELLEIIHALWETQWSARWPP